MNKIKKYQLIKFLKIFKEYGCNNIEDIIKLLNKDLENDDDIVFRWEERKIK